MPHLLLQRLGGDAVAAAAVLRAAADSLDPAGTVSWHDNCSTNYATEALGCQTTPRLVAGLFLLVLILRPLSVLLVVVVQVAR